MKRYRFFSDTSAATAIEYGLIVALIALTIIGALRILGDETAGMWSNVGNSVTEAMGTKN